jgi:hypothetical protein
VSRGTIIEAVNIKYFPSVVRLLSSSSGSVGLDCAMCIAYVAALSKDWAPIIKLLQKTSACDRNRRGAIFVPIFAILQSNSESRILVGLLHILRGLFDMGSKYCDEHDQNHFIITLERCGMFDAVIGLQASVDGDVQRLANECVLKCGILKMVCGDVGADDHIVSATACSRLRRTLQACLSDEVAAIMVDSDTPGRLVQLLTSSNSSTIQDCAAVLGFYGEWVGKIRVACAQPKLISSLIQPLNDALTLGASGEGHELLPFISTLKITADNRCVIGALFILQELVKAGRNRCEEHDCNPILIVMLRHNFLDIISSLQLSANTDVNHRSSELFSKLEFCRIYVELTSSEVSTQAAAACCLKQSLQVFLSDAIIVAVQDAGILAAVVKLLASGTSSICCDLAVCLCHLAACACKRRDASSGSAALEQMIRLLHGAVFVQSSGKEAVLIPFLSILKSSGDSSLIFGVLHLLQGIVTASQQDCIVQPLNPCFTLLEGHGFSDAVIRLQSSLNPDVQLLASDCLVKCEILQNVFAELQSDDCTIAAVAASRLRQSLQACASDAVFSAAMSANVAATLVQQLLSPVLSVGDDCAACLCHLVKRAVGQTCSLCRHPLAGCACKLRNASSGSLDQIIRLLHGAVFVQSSGKEAVLIPFLSILKSSGDSSLIIYSLFLFQAMFRRSQQRCTLQPLNPCFTLLEGHGFSDAVIRLQSSLNPDVQLLASGCLVKCEILQNVFAELQSDDCTIAAVAASRLRQSLQACASDAVFSAAMSANVAATLVQQLLSPVLSVGDDCAACLCHLAACACKRRDASSGSAALAQMIRLLHGAVFVQSSGKEAVLIPFLSILKSSGDSSLIFGVLHLLQGIVTASQQHCIVQPLNPCFTLLEGHGFSDAVIRLQSSLNPDVQLLASGCLVKCEILQNVFAELQSDDCTIAAVAASRLRQSLQACASDAVFSAAMSANVAATLVQQLLSPVLSVGDDCAACLCHLAACACKLPDASSGSAALAQMVQLLHEAIIRDSTGKYVFFRPFISQLSSPGGNLCMGLSNLLHGVLSSSSNASLFQELVTNHSILSIFVQVLESPDNSQCFPALLGVISKIVHVGERQGAIHGHNPYVIELIRLNAARVFRCSHLVRELELKDSISEITQFLDGTLLQKVQSEAIPAADDTTVFLESLVESLAAVVAAHTRPADPCLRPRPDDVVRSSMRGDAAALVPSVWFEEGSKQRVVRVFLSSTFTDTVHERAVLLRCVHPVVQFYARKLNFEVVLSEMRFGIRKSLSEDNKTSEVCMMELERCAEESASMSYMLFVRNKYGFRPPPRRVPRVDMEAMLALMPPGDKDLVQDFYELDENELISPQACYRISVNMHGAANSQDAAYVLRNTSLIANYWSRFSQLQTALRIAASLHWPSAVSELDNYRSQHPIRFFFFSVTEEEICRGLFWKDARDVHDTAHVFLRPIEAAGGGDIASMDPDSKELLNFVDVSDKKIDSSAQDRLGTLRQMINEATSHAPSIVSASGSAVEWLDGTGFHPRHAPHAIDLQKFACAATVSLLESLDSANERLAFQPHPDMAEAIHHMNFAHVRSCTFAHSNETQHVTAKLRDYLASAVGPGHAFVIHGASGSGKTYLMAEAADREAHALSSPGDAVIVRFLGTSPASSNLTDLLSSLCRQLFAIQAVYVAFFPSSDDVEQLKEYFDRSMKTWQTGRLTVFLDSLDQLDDTYGGRKLGWLPTHGISPNVRLVVSTLPDEASPADGKPFACLSILQKRYSGSQSDSAITEVQPVDDVRSLLLHLLKLRQHTLSDAQLQLLEAAMKLSPRTQTPLVVTILAVRFSEWPSHRDIPPDNKNPDGSLFIDTSSVRALIIQEFNSLEAKHGSELVRAALSFITLAKDGVSETELSEILSLDDDVLASVYEWWVPPVRTLPTTPLTMLLADLKPYLTMRGAANGGGGLMICWYHCQFWEAADVYFLHDADERRLRHAQLGEFFSGSWADRSKPYNDRLRAVVQEKVAGEVSGDRRVRPQPLCLREGKIIFATKGDTGAVNERRCREAAHHWLAAGMLCEAADELCSFEGICARARCGEGQATLIQLLDLSDSIRQQVCARNAAALHRLKQVEHFAKWLQKDLTCIVADPDMQVIIESCSRQPVVSEARKELIAYMQRTSAGVNFGVGSLHRSFVLGASHWDFDPCISDLQYHKRYVSCVAYNFGSSLLASASGDSTVAVWNTKTWMVESVLKGHTCKVTSVTWSPDSLRLATSEIQRSHQ